MSYNCQKVAVRALQAVWLPLLNHRIQRSMPSCETFLFSCRECEVAQVKPPVTWPQVIFFIELFALSRPSGGGGLQVLALTHLLVPARVCSAPPQQFIINNLSKHK